MAIKMNPKNNYTLLIAKLDEFIKKYHQQKLIRGCIYFASFTLISFLLINSLEFYLFLSPLIKKILWLVYLLAVLYLIIKWLMQAVKQDTRNISIIEKLVFDTVDIMRIVICNTKYVPPIKIT